MKIKTTQLSDLALDWAVTKAEGGDLANFTHQHAENSWRWSDAEQGGSGLRILEREGIATRRHKSGKWSAIASSDLGEDLSPSWNDFTFKDLPKGACTSRRQCFEGPSLLVAGLRCHVAMRLGEVIDVPDELFQEVPEERVVDRQRG